jgi:formylglycine-generating enzyme required for sulfatase activity
VKESIPETKSKSMVVLLKCAGSNRNREETGPVEEVDQESANIKTGGLFRRALTELQTRTRTVSKTRTVSENIPEQEVRIEFCHIPAGSFWMGEKRQYHVTISRNFYMGKFTVTQSQWEAVMGENPSKFKGPDRPVETVSWEDCQRFIGRLNEYEGRGIYRLPTEAEWEYVCRAGSETAYCFGNDENQLGEYAWYEVNSGHQTHGVGKKKPNAWGLYDLHGNVWEWCQDWLGYFPEEPATDPAGPPSGSHRVRRGGGWLYGAQRCRSAHRYGSAPGNRLDDVGLRLLRSADEL